MGIHAHTHARTHTHTHTHTYTREHTYTHIYMYTHIYIYIYVYIYRLKIKVFIRSNIVNGAQRTISEYRKLGFDIPFVVDKVSTCYTDDVALKE